MKIIHICANDFDGAGTSSYRLHLSLKSVGIDSKMLVLSKKRKDDDIVPYTEWVSLTKRFINRLRKISIKSEMRFWYENVSQDKDYFSSDRSVFRVNRHPLVQQADVIILHWIAGLIDYISFFKNIDKPILWVTADVNPFTGGCHLSGECKNYEMSCGSCPQISAAKEIDISRKIYSRKSRAYQNIDMNIVSLSTYFGNKIKRSSLLSRFPIHVIPNGISATTFSPRDPAFSRHLLELPENDILILFGSQYYSKQKGLSHLIEAAPLLNLPKTPERKIHLVTFGNCLPSSPITIDNLAIDIITLGYIDNELILSCLYSAADFLVMPSLEESFGQICLESMACGTPVVSYELGGMVDMIKHMENGILVPKGNIAKLAAAITFMLNNIHQRKRMGTKARETILNSYTTDRQASDYRRLIVSIM